MRTFTLTGFAAFLSEVSFAMPMVEHSALEQAAVIVETEAKRVIGTYDYGWPQLAESTQNARAAAGYPANEPLLVTGEMRQSIEHIVIGREAHVGSNNDKAVWQELGTKHIPPRSFLAGAAVHKQDEVAHAIGRAVTARLSSGGVSSTGHPFDDVSFKVL